jgi:hypothetical protein
MMHQVLVHRQAQVAKKGQVVEDADTKKHAK